MPLLGITMGCPAGIGPEITLRSSLAPRPTGYEIVVLGDLAILEKARDQLGLAVTLVPYHPGQKTAPGSLAVYQCSHLDPAVHQWGRPDQAGGSAMAAYITEAVALCRRDILAGIVTCPIAKSTLNQAGYHFPGHTEMLASLTGCDQVTMMMAGPTLRVTLASIHCRLADVPERLNRDALFRLITVTERALRVDFGIHSPRVAVAALNPHAGEQGMFGREEKEIIAPAVAAAAAAGIAVSGPYPPDTVFVKAAAGNYDGVVCMYHDQGLIPFKLLHFADGVNVTLGLPLVRTSVDHGTAYDIAGKGLADSTSLTAAINMAAVIHHNRSLARQGERAP